MRIPRIPEEVHKSYVQHSVSWVRSTREEEWIYARKLTFQFPVPIESNQGGQSADCVEYLIDVHGWGRECTLILPLVGMENTHELHSVQQNHQSIDSSFYLLNPYPPWDSHTSMTLSHGSYTVLWWIKEILICVIALSWRQRKSPKRKFTKIWVLLSTLYYSERDTEMVL